MSLAQAGPAAAALEALRGGLDQHVPALQAMVKSLDARHAGAGLPAPAALQQLHGRAPRDAAQLRDAYQIAERMNNQQVARQVALRACPSGILSIGVGWDPAALAVAAATADAKALTAALASNDAGTARTAIGDVASDLAGHQGDTSYLTAFWSQKGVPEAAANLAAVLNRQDGHGTTLLSAQDQQVLGAIGGALAAATRAGRLGPAAGQRLIDGFTQAPDAWSAAMLFGKVNGAGFGAGQGSQLIAAVTRKVLDTRETGHYSLPLNLSEGSRTHGPALIPAALKAYDPLQAMLRAGAQNNIAATEVLGGPGGDRYAHELLNTPDSRYINTPAGVGGEALQSVSPDPDAEPQGPDLCGTVLDQQTVAGFLDAATRGTDPKSAPPRGTSTLAYQAAQAALNIIGSTPGPDGNSVSEPVRRALVNTFGRYLPDLASSMQVNARGAAATPVPSSDGSTYLIQLDGADTGAPLSVFLAQIAASPRDAGVIQGSTLAAMSNAFGLQAKGVKNSLNDDLAGAYASLYGAIVTAQQNRNYSQQEVRDARDTMINQALSGMWSPVLFYPVALPETLPLRLLLGSRGISEPFLNMLVNQPVNAAATAAEHDVNAFGNDEALVQVPLLQGLINSGVIAVPTNTDPRAGRQVPVSWYKHAPGGGRVLPDPAMDTWINTHHAAKIWALPGYEGPGKELNTDPGDTRALVEIERNPTDGMSLGQALSTYQGLMSLTREQHTDEGN